MENILSLPSGGDGGYHGNAKYHDSLFDMDFEEDFDDDDNLTWGRQGSLWD